METNTLLNTKNNQVKLNHIGKYLNLTDIQLLEMIEKIIEKANSTNGLNKKSATEILLEDRR